MDSIRQRQWLLAAISGILQVLIFPSPSLYFLGWIALVPLLIADGFRFIRSTPLVRGRFFNDRDNEANPGVVIVDERLARKFWPDADAIGKRMYRPENPSDLLNPGPNTRWFTGTPRSIIASRLLRSAS